MTPPYSIIDKSENNPLHVKGKGIYDKGKTHPAWMQWLNVKTGQYKALDGQTNSFCAGGSFLSNGTMLSVGGNPATSASSYYDGDGLTSVRMFDDCGDDGCTLVESPDTLRLSSARWYPGLSRLQDGSVIIMGGMTESGFNNVEATDNPTFEYFPPKTFGDNLGLPIYSKFLHDSLNSNLFPISYLMPATGYLFVAANERVMVYDWVNGKEHRLDDIPNGVRCTYPWSSATGLLPLTIDNSWTPEILLCGGSTLDDQLDVTDLSSQDPASALCFTIVISKTTSKTGWVAEKSLPTTRTMGETVLLPDGMVLIVNGAKTGMAGYGDVPDQIGSSDADNPAYRGVLYNPTTRKLASTFMPTSKIPRMYHSAATLLASGEVVIMGSNPNDDVSTQTYQTEYRIEFLEPPYMKSTLRPCFNETWFPSNLLYGTSFGLRFTWPGSGPLVKDDISIVLMDYGYHTHAVAVNQRLVQLVISSYTAPSHETNGEHQLLVKAPKDGTYFAPGYGWLHVLVKGVPSTGLKVMVGDGSDPPSTKAAYKNLMKKTKNLGAAPMWYDASSSTGYTVYSG